MTSFQQRNASPAAARGAPTSGIVRQVESALADYDRTGSRSVAPAAMQRVEFEGQLHEFPSDFTDDEIRSALEQSTASAPIEAELYDGTILEFPAGTSPDVIQRVAREQTQLRRSSGAGAIPPPPPGFVLDQPAAPASQTPAAGPWTRYRQGAVPPPPPGFVLDQPAGPTLTPVDHNPFAAPAGPRLVPVDHDPFAAASIPQMPDFAPRPAADGTGREIYGDQVDRLRGDGWNLPDTDAVDANADDWRYSRFGNLVEDVGRDTGVVTQALGRAALDTVGLPAEAGALTYNLASAVINAPNVFSSWVGGEDLYPRTPYMGSPTEAAAGAISGLAEQAGYPVIHDDEMSDREQLLSEIVRFGGGALMGGGALRSVAQARAPSTTPRRLDPLLRPYEGSGAVETLARDTAAGAGAGAGVATYDSMVGEEDRGALGSILAMLGGGIGGSGLFDVVRSGPSAFATALRRAGIDRVIPYDEIGQPTSNATSDAAARYMQTEAGGRAPAREAADEIGRSTDMARGAGAPVPPTGQASQNTGLARVERAVTNTAGGTPVIDRNRAISTWGANEIQNIGPDADPGVFVQAAGATRGRLIGDATRGVNDAEQAASAAEAQRVLDAEQIAGRFGGQAVRDQASETVDRILTDDIEALRRRRNELSSPDVIDPGREIELPAGPIAGAAGRVRDAAGALLDPYAGRAIPPVVDALESFSPHLSERTVTSPILDASGRPVTRTETVNAGGSGRVPLTTLTESVPRIVRGQRAGALRGAAGDPSGYDVADALRGVRNTIGGQLEDYAATGGTPQAERLGEALEAQGAFRERYRVGERGDVLPDFVNDLENPAARGRTAPTRTLPSFVRPEPGGAEATAGLIRRGLESSDPAAFQEAARTFVLSHAADAIIDNGQISVQRLNRFRRDWSSVIARVPGLPVRLSELAEQASRGEATAHQLTAELTAARGRLQMTEQELADSALALVVGATPRRAIGSIASSRNPPEMMRDLRERLRGIPGADESLQRAVGDWLYSRVTSTAVGQTTDGSLPPTLGRLINLEENPDLVAMMAAVFSPEDMNALQRVRRVFDMRGILSAAQGAAGSPTAANLDGVMRLFEAGMRTVYGGFRGGNITRNIRVGLAPLLTGRDDAVQRLVARAMTDPGIARHLLSREIAENPQAWASRLSQLLRRAEGARQVNEDWFGQSDQ